MQNLTDDQISRLSQIVREVAEEDMFKVDEVSISVSGETRIELSYNVFVDYSDSFTSIIEEYLIPRSISARDDILDFLYEEMYDFFIEDVAFDTTKFKARSEEVFRSFTVDEFLRFIENIECDIAFKLDNVADKIVEQMEEYRG